ncbi:MAG: MBL fold metallo-hydrolase [Clostridia bacterium]|nr:MBL fold metallo-hydrolase [Clostridia bacterium]
MRLYHLSSGPLRVNTYFLVDENSREAVCIDGGENYRLIKKTEQDNGFTVKHLLLTHAHFDHAGNAAALQKDGALVYASAPEADKLKNGGTLAENFGRAFTPVQADVILKDGDILDLVGVKIEVMLTAGHTDGSLTFKTGDMLFTGDTLFLESVGRTDFPTGDRNALIRSVQKLFALSGDFKVYPGHEDFTTLSHERKYNLMSDVDI